jgi:hypothetical protein
MVTELAKQFIAGITLPGSSRKYVCTYRRRRAIIEGNWMCEVAVAIFIPQRKAVLYRPVVFNFFCSRTPDIISLRPKLLVYNSSYTQSTINI